MCEFCNKKQKVYEFIQRGMPGGLITPSMLQVFPYLLNPYCCPACGRRLQPHELDGATSRSLCPACFNRMVASQIVRNCMICLGNLPHEKVIGQQQNAREIRAKIHEGDCFARWVLIHNVAHGEQDMIQLAHEMLPASGYQDNQGRGNNHYHPRQALPEPGYQEDYPAQQGYHSSRVSRRVRQAVRRAAPNRALPDPVRRQALPYPSRQEHVPDRMPHDGREPDYIDVDFYDWNRHR